MALIKHNFVNFPISVNHIQKGVNFVLINMRYLVVLHSSNGLKLPPKLSILLHVHLSIALVFVCMYM